MSLFKARDWWSVECSTQEDFDQNCLHVSNIDNNPDGQDKLVVGSQSGLLQIYGPTGTAHEDTGLLKGFQASELLLECHLGIPILHISSGRLIMGNSQLQLALLHPRKLSVYSVTVNQGTVDHGTNYQLNLVYEHKLQRSAFNFVVGSFGEVKGRDLLCVQSLDGVLSFYEQDSFAFSRFLPGFLLPGPLAYAAKVDSILTISSSWLLESYRYPSLAVAQEVDIKEESQTPIKGKRVQADWSFNVGESVVDLVVLEPKNAPATIFVLGEKNIFALKENGVLRYTKRMDYVPNCCWPYESSVEESIMLLVCTVNQTLLVYQDATLKWAAQLSFPPICVQRATLGSVPGMLVMLSEQGCLTCSYLGTDPSFLITPAPEIRDLDYLQAEKELKQLRAIISARDADSSDQPVMNDLIIQTRVVDSHYRGNTDDGNQTVPTVRVQVNLLARVPVQDVCLVSEAPCPLVVEPTLLSFPDLNNNNQAELRVRMKMPFLPSSLQLRILATYTVSGEPRVSEGSADLPIWTVLTESTPTKVAPFKITLDTSKPCLSLYQLFPEFSVQHNDEVANGMGFQYLLGGPTVTILAAKSSQRYRVQTESFPALQLVVHELLERLKQHFPRGGLKVTYPAPLPLQELFVEVQEHMQNRALKLQLDQALQQQASQFRIIQKCLLTKIKDKTAAPLNNLDILLEATYHQLLNLSDSALESSQQLLSTSCSLSCCVKLLKILVLLQNATCPAAPLLDTLLPHNISPYPEEGWEERVDATLTYLLRTCLSKPGKEPPIATEHLLPLSDVNRLRKHLTVVIDRIGKGSPITFTAQKNDDVEKKENAEDSELLGSQLGERKVVKAPA